MIENLVIITAGVAIIGYVLDRKTQQKIQYESDTYVKKYLNAYRCMINKLQILNIDDKTKVDTLKMEIMHMIRGDSSW